MAAESLLREALDGGEALAGAPLARVLVRQGEQEEALRVLRSCADFDPEARSELGVLLRHAGREDQARAVLEAGVAADEVESVVPLANLLADAGEEAAAELLLRKGIAMGDSYCHNNLGLLLLDGGRVEEAEEQFRLGAAAGDDLAVQALAELLADRSDPRA